jgi:hypothetical protein
MPRGEEAKGTGRDPRPVEKPRSRHHCGASTRAMLARANAIASDPRSPRRSWIGQSVQMTHDQGDAEANPRLTTAQAYETAYRFVAQYYTREPVVPLLLMLSNMEWRGQHQMTGDPSSWADWNACVQRTLDRAPLPDIPSLNG